MNLLKSRKTLYIFLIISIIVNIFFYYQSNLINRLMPLSYSAYQLSQEKLDGELFTASGAWISTTPLSRPLQSASLECWKSFGHCWIKTFEVDEKTGYMTQFSELERISIWTDDKIETIPSQTGSGCAEYVYKINRREQTITSTRTTISATGSCAVLDKEPIVMKLGSGYERIENWKRYHNK